MKKLNQHQIAEILKSHYDCIEKIDAIKFIKLNYGSLVDLRDIVKAYEMCNF